MSINNTGPKHGVHGGHDAFDGSRRGNSTPVLRDELTDEVLAASGRATTVTHRFGGVRHALTRPTAPAADRRPPPEEGDSDARE